MFALSQPGPGFQSRSPMLPYWPRLARMTLELSCWPAVEAVGEGVVDRQVIELRRGLVVLRAPALAAVERDRRTAVVAVDHVAAVHRVDPERVIVAVLRRQHLEALPAVDRAEDRRVEHVHDVGVLRIGDDFHVVPRPRLDQAVIVEQAPAAAGIVGAVEAPLVGLHDGVDAIGVGRRHGDADLAHELRQPLRQPGPAVAAVGGLPDAAAGAAAADDPRRALVVPERGVEDARVGRIHGEVGGAAGRVLALQHQRPVLAAVDGAVDAAVGRAGPAVTLRGHVDDVRILRVHDDGGDLPRVVEAEVCPGAALIGGPVDAVAERRRLAAHRMLAHTGVDHVRIARRHGERADGAVAQLAVGDVAPADAGVVGAPDAAAGVAGEEGERLSRYAGDGDATAAAFRSRVAPVQRAEGGGVRPGGGGGGGRAGARGGALGDGNAGRAGEGRGSGAGGEKGAELESEHRELKGWDQLRTFARAFDSVKENGGRGVWGVGCGNGAGW